MTQRARIEPAAPGLLRNTPRAGYVRFPLAIATAEVAFSLGICAFVDLFHDGEVAVSFSAGALVLGAVAAWELTHVRRPNVTSAPAVLTMATLAWLALALYGAVVHLAADATNSIDTAIMEGTAAATTTAMSGLDVDTMPNGLIMFRALMQWFGGLGGLILAIVVIPLAMGGRSLRTHGFSVQGSRPLISGRTRGTAQLTLLYVGLTGGLLLGFLVVGVGLFDAIIHALATASTGGMSSRSGSLSALDNAGAEWIASLGMIAAGLNVGIVWWLMQGRWRPAVRSTEFRMFVATLVASIAAITAWLASSDVDTDALRTATVSVSSAMSTTGLTTQPWWTFPNGAQALVLGLVGVGAMAGSVGAGFHYQRLLEASRFARRELTRQIHPTAVSVVRMGGRAVSERQLDQLTGFMMLFVISAGLGGMLVDLGDASLTSRNAIALSVSALTTNGAQLVDPVDLSSIGWLSKVALSALMLLGRLSIYGVVLAALTVTARVGEHLRARARRTRATR